MPGQTDNIAILASLNQLIQAINDKVLAVTIEPATPSVNLSCPPPTISVTCGTMQVPGIGGPGGGPIVDQPPSSSVPVNEDKCQRCNYLVDMYIEYLSNWIVWEAALTTTPAAIFAGWLGNTPLVFSSLVLAGATVVLFWYVVTLAIGGLALSAVLAIYKSNVESVKNDFVCSLYNASNATDAREVVRQYLNDTLPVGLPSSWIDYHLDNLFPYNVLNGIFDGWTAEVEAALAAYNPLDPVDCAGCGGGGCANTFNFDGSFQDWQGLDQFGQPSATLCTLDSTTHVGRSTVKMIPPGASSNNFCHLKRILNCGNFGISYWLYQETGLQNVATAIYAHWSNGSETVIGNHYNATVGAWTQYTNTITAPVGATLEYIYISHSATAPRVRAVWVDDIIIT